MWHIHNSCKVLQNLVLPANGTFKEKVKFMEWCIIPELFHSFHVSMKEYHRKKSPEKDGSSNAFIFEIHVCQVIAKGCGRHFLSTCLRWSHIHIYTCMRKLQMMYNKTWQICYYFDDSKTSLYTPCYIINPFKVVSTHFRSQCNRLKRTLFHLINLLTSACSCCNLLSI